jgi:hypothetical protein
MTTSWPCTAWGGHSACVFWMRGNRRISYHRHSRLPLLGRSIDSGGMTTMLLLSGLPAEAPTSLVCARRRPKLTIHTLLGRACHQPPGLEAPLGISPVGARLLYGCTLCAEHATSITHLLKRNYPVCLACHRNQPSPLTKFLLVVTHEIQIHIHALKKMLKPGTCDGMADHPSI